ncbi:hypothetical protein PSU4_35020 [Pseudonocardia sulfidoxydans NBRC 16205]|uniref:Uncharacterized protein n=1 Tax=Pseudonocardia sulfidoxydans NBRC 16205 TaxID=1223511 RepID=A0A511DN98_9PSEU|nr:hypothetical protein PSU4_35020 [Pseudonocardia sulfidoxydans NBRC 16205]
MYLESDGEAVGGGAGQAGAFAELGEAARFGGRGAKYAHCLVEHADPARLSHASILASQHLGGLGRSTTTMRRKREEAAP